MARILFLAPFFAIAAVVVYFVFLKSPPPLPDLDLNAWWGPTELKAKQDNSIRPFKIKFKEEMIQDLKQRIKSVRELTPPLEGTKLEYGFNTKELGSWLQYWANEYPFAERQKFLNQFQQYKTNIQGLNIHFISVRPEVPAGVEIVPVLMLHGWPGSVREFYEAIPLLTAVEKGRDFALEVIVPSLPGYGFSDPAVRPGLGAAEIAVVFRNLMQRLGFKKYYLQGGDAGSFICRHLATLFPSEVLGYHTNAALAFSITATLKTIVGSFFPSLVVEDSLADRIYPLSEKLSKLVEESGYFHLQSTKPDTVGVALSDSPSGLLAYILEKFGTFTDENKRSLLDNFTKEKLIDNLMFYWATNSVTTSMRLYAEIFNKRQMGLQLDEIPTPVPVWALQSKYEIMYQTPWIFRNKFPNLVNATVLETGGHFLAFELPEIFAADVVKAIGEFRKINKNAGKTEL